MATHKEFNIYTEDEVNEYLALVKDAKMELPVMLTAIYGLRRSEVVALKVSDLIREHVNDDNYVGISRKDYRGLYTAPLVDAMLRYSSISMLTSCGSTATKLITHFTNRRNE